jgi:Domain of unknown function (DUF4135)
MLSQISLAQLACRASNLAERLFLLKQLSPPQKSQPLTSRDLQIVQQDLEQLFPAVDATQDSIYQLKRRAIRQSLRLFRWYEQNLATLSTAQQQTFLAVHSSWIQTYEQAVTVYYREDLSQDAIERRHPADRLSVSAPFLQLIAVKLKKVFDELSPRELFAPCQARLIAAVQRFFSQRIALMAAQPRPILDPQKTDAEGRALACHSFFLSQPVLARWLAQVCADTIRFVQVAVTRLSQDRCDLALGLWDGDLPRQITQISLSQDKIQGQWSATFGLQLDSGAVHQVRYYPYALEAERALRTLWAQIDRGQSSTADLNAVLCCKGYGYLRVRAAPRKSPEELRQLGQRTALRNLMGQQPLWQQVQVGIWSSDTVDPAEANFAAGVESVQSWLNQPTLGIQALKTCFREVSAQLCHRSSAAYLLLLVTAQQRFLLTNPLSIDAIFQTLVKQPCLWDKAGEIAQLEVKMLWQFKAPCFRVLMNRRYMSYDPEHVLFSKLPMTPLEFLTQAVLDQASLSCTDRASAQLLSAVS